MSYFADVKCPKCGKTKQLHLGGFGFYGHDKEECNYCGYEYNPQDNCTNCEQDRDYEVPKKENNEDKEYQEYLRLKKKFEK